MEPTQFVKAEVELPKKTYELATALAKFAQVCIKEVNDNGGFSAGDDLPAVAIAAIEMLPSLSDLTSLADESKQNAGAFIAAIAIAFAPVTELIRELKK